MTPDPAPRQRNGLLLRTSDGRHLSLHVKTRRTGSWQSDIRKGRRRKPDASDTSFWVFVDLTTDPAEFFITSASWMENDIYERHAEYLARNDGHRRDTPSSMHHGIGLDRIERWHDRWDLIGLAPSHRR